MQLPVSVTSATSGYGTAADPGPKRHRCHRRLDGTRDLRPAHDGSGTKVGKLTVTFTADGGPTVCEGSG